MTDATDLSLADAIHIEAIYPSFHHEAGVSYSIKLALEGMASETVTVGATVMAKHRDVRQRYVHPLINRYAYRFLGPHIKDPMRWVFRAARRRLRAGDVAYFWCESPIDMVDELRARNIMVVREMINCTKQVRRDVMRQAYVCMDEIERSEISDEMIERERRDLMAVDAVFCPNPFVKSSVIAYGVPPERCMEASYAWSAERLGSEPTRRSPEIFTVAFVGTIDVRKGAPLLLDAWIKYGIPGRLLLAGEMSPEVERRYSAILSRPDIVCLGYVRDIGSVYQAADAFCFPTWEEGGPQVTLEAMAMGCVPVVTPMGTAGAFTAHEDVGLVIPPGDVDALGQTLCALAADRQRLEELRRKTLERARNYSWEVVGRRRRITLLARRACWLDAHPESSVGPPSRRRPLGSSQ